MTAEFTRNFSIVMKVLKTTHYILKAKKQTVSFFRGTPRPPPPQLLDTTDYQYNTSVIIKDKRETNTNTSRNINTKYADTMQYLLLKNEKLLSQT
jgi:hypothetical protein